MKISRAAWVFGGAGLLAIAGVTAVACSSSSTPTPIPTGNKDAGTPQDSSMSNPDTSMMMEEDAGMNMPVDSGVGIDSGTPACAKPPMIFAPKDGGFYCPFGPTGNDAGSLYCATPTQTCCVSPSNDAGSSVCETPTPADGGGIACTQPGFGVWQCGAPADCTGQANSATTCCLTSGAVEPDNACQGFNKTKGFDALQCVPSAQCTGTVMIGTFSDVRYVVCTTTADCVGPAAGKTCTAVHTTGIGVGICL